MKRSFRRSVSIVLSVALLCHPAYVLAAAPKASYVPPTSPQLVSNRLIVKYKANDLPKGLSVAQINAQLSQPLSTQALSQLQAAAGVALTEVRAISHGAHVLAIAGKPNRKTLGNAISGIRALPGIEYVEEDSIMTAQAVPADLYYTTGPTGDPGLWGLWPATTVASPAPGGTGSYGADFQTAWDTGTGTGVVVAVIDTGITPSVDIVGPGGTVAAGAGSNLVSTGYDFTTDCRMRGTCAANTPDVSAYVAPSPDATDLGDFVSAADAATPFFTGCTISDSSWHGTHVAGTIAAIGNNDIGVTGGAYAAKILPVRVLGKCGGYLSDIAEGIRWAAGVHPTIANPNPAKVINMSLGGSGVCGTTYQSAINAAVGAGTVVVVAAGNSNAGIANSRPANCTNVISVAAIARDGSRAAYSNYSSSTIKVTLAAQGGDQGSYPPAFDPGILSTLNAGTTTPVLTGGSSYVYYQGTSMATPHVAAAAALMLEQNPLLTPAQIKTIVSAPSSLTAFPAFDPTWASWDCATTKHCGAGVLNAKLAVQNSAPTALSAPATSEFGSVLANGTVTKVVTLTNTSMAPVDQAGAITVTGLDAALFTIGANSCTGAVVAPNGTCQISLAYAPTAGGAHTATLTVPIRSFTGPVGPSTLVSLNGSAGTTVLTTSTPSVTPPTVTLGQSSSANLSYTNPNADAMTTGAITLSKPGIMAISSDGCSNQVLAAGASCNATVTVTPLSAGSYSGTASLALSGGGTAAEITISGTINPPPSPPPSSGGGGCSVMPLGADPDASLLFAMLAIAGYWLRRRIVRERSAG